jgi:hypothetical protein
LGELLRVGARQLISQAVGAGLRGFLERHAGRLDERSRRAVVRNGYLPGREVLTGIGPVRDELPTVGTAPARTPAFARGWCPRMCGASEAWRRCCRGRI